MISSYPISGARATVWLKLRPSDRLNGMINIVLKPAGWWNGLGIGFWVFGDGAIRSSDTSPLDVISEPNGAVHLIAKTLSNGTTDVTASSANTRLAVVADSGGGRVVSHKKQVQICASVTSCRTAATDHHAVTLDPAWAPDGNNLVFVHAPDYSDSGWPQRLAERWYSSHRLVLYNASTRRAQALPATEGATVPAWAPDGKSLLYVANDGLWLLPTLRGKPIEIATPLFPRHKWPTYYGQVAWTAQFAWSSH